MFGVTATTGSLIEFRGSDRVYVDSEDIGLVRKLHRRRDAEA